jgi:hypothetical protein
VDLFTLGTFLALGLSYLTFLIYRGLDISLGFAEAVSQLEGIESYANFEKWYLKN